MGERIRDYFAGGVGRIAGFLPNLISAAVILAVGYVVSRLAGSLLRRLLARTRFDGFAARHFRRTDSRRPASAIAGAAVFWLGMLITVSMASNSLGLYALSAGLNQILGFIPNVLVAAIIVGVAIPVSRVLASMISRGTGATVARAAQVAVIAFACFMALDQLGVSTTIVTTTFVALLGAVAVAAAIAFGIGSIPTARHFTERLVRRSESRVEAEAQEERERERERASTTSTPPGVTEH